MFVPFPSISSESRIWIFQADRQMVAEEMAMAETRLRRFTEEWNVHGNPLETSFTIRFNQLIVLAADESAHGTSGCSIDSSVNVLKEIGQAIGIDFFNRNQVAFHMDGKIILMALSQLKQNFLDGMWNGETLTFNNLVSTKSQFEGAWLLPAGQTWLKRYIPGELVKLK